MTVIARRCSSRPVDPVDAVTELTRVIRFNLKSGLREVGKQIDDEPDNLIATELNDRGGLLAVNSGKTVEAMENFYLAIRFAPRLAVAHANLGTSFLQAGFVSFVLAARTVARSSSTLKTIA